MSGSRPVIDLQELLNQHSMSGLVRQMQGPVGHGGQPAAAAAANGPAARAQAQLHINLVDDGHTDEGRVMRWSKAREIALLKAVHAKGTSAFIKHEDGGNLTKAWAEKDGIIPCLKGLPIFNNANWPVSHVSIHRTALQLIAKYKPDGVAEPILEDLETAELREMAELCAALQDQAEAEVDHHTALQRKSKKAKEETEGGKELRANFVRSYSALPQDVLGTDPGSKAARKKARLDEWEADKDVEYSRRGYKEAVGEERASQLEEEGKLAPGWRRKTNPRTGEEVFFKLLGAGSSSGGGGGGRAAPLRGARASMQALTEQLLKETETEAAAEVERKQGEARAAKEREADRALERERLEIEKKKVEQQGALLAQMMAAQTAMFEELKKRQA